MILHFDVSVHMSLWNHRWKALWARGLCLVYIPRAGQIVCNTEGVLTPVAWWKLSDLQTQECRMSTQPSQHFLLYTPSLPSPLFPSYFFKKIFLFSPCRAACGILVPQQGIEPGPLAVKAPSPNHWTARAFPLPLFSLLKSGFPLA